MHRVSLTFCVGLCLAACTAAATASSLVQTSSCEPTKPNGYTPPGAHARSNNHGADGLAVNLWTATAGSVAWQYDASARAVSVKYGWFTPHNAAPTITGRRLDGPAPALIADVGALTWDEGDFFPSLLYFPTRGCWQVTASAGGTTLTFGVDVGAGPDAWRPPAAPSPRARISARDIIFEWTQRVGCGRFDVSTRRGRNDWRVVHSATVTTSYTVHRTALGLRYALRLRCRDMFGSGKWGLAQTTVRR